MPPSTDKIETPDFTKPCKQMSVHGFPVQFKPMECEDGVTLWLPTGITRHKESRGWRIIFSHADGKYRDWIGDRGRPMLETLALAWRDMVDEMRFMSPQITEVRRTRRPGPARDSRIDTGITGLLIARSKARGNRSNTIAVRTFQRIRDPEKTSRAIAVDTLRLSESVYRESPEYHQKRFRDALCWDAAVRKAYTEAYAKQGGPIIEPVYPEEIDRSRVPQDPVRDLYLKDIFDSF